MERNMTNILAISLRLCRCLSELYLKTKLSEAHKVSQAKGLCEGAANQYTVFKGKEWEICNNDLESVVNILMRELVCDFGSRSCKYIQAGTFYCFMVFKQHAYS